MGASHGSGACKSRWTQLRAQQLVPVHHMWHKQGTVTLACSAAPGPQSRHGYRRRGLRVLPLHLTPSTTAGTCARPVEVPLPGSAPCILQPRTWAPTAAGSCMASHGTTRVLAILSCAQPDFLPRATAQPQIDVRPLPAAGLDLLIDALCLVCVLSAVLKLPCRCTLTPGAPQVAYMERLGAVGRIPGTAKRQDMASSAQRARGALLRQTLAGLLPPGYHRQLQVLLPAR